MDYVPTEVFEYRPDGKKRTIPTLEGEKRRSNAPRDRKDFNPFLGTTIPEGQPPQSKWAHPKELEFSNWWWAYVEFEKVVGYDAPNIKMWPLPEPGGRWLLEAKGGPEGTLYYHFVWDKQRVHVDEMQGGWSEEGRFWLACPMDERWAPYKANEDDDGKDRKGKEGGEGGNKDSNPTSVGTQG